MILSISLFLFIGVLSNYLSSKTKLPSLLGMLIGGIIIGPFCLNLINQDLLDISADLRKIALIIILIRAGFTLDITDLKKVGISAFLMCFLPASFEILGTAIVAPIIFHFSILESLLLGAVLAAVSPAVIVPKMITLIENKTGTKKGIPQLILAGASIDDIFVIVLFTAFLNLNQGFDINLLSFINIPVSIILGVILGIIIGKLLNFIYKRINIPIIYKVIFLLAVALLIVYTEDHLTTVITFSGLIATMFIGISLKQDNKDISEEMSKYFNKLWNFAEIFLFILVGASVNITLLGSNFLLGILLIVLILLFRSIGVLISVNFTNFSLKEKLFCIISYTPKATVQAAIAGIPLSVGLDSGNLILVVAIIAILFTAPIGAFLIDRLTPLLKEN